MRKNFRWALEVDGLNMFLAQEVTSPSVEFAEILHGRPANLPDAKTAGKMKIGDLVLLKGKPESEADTWIWDWLAKVAAGTAAQYQKNAFLVELAPDGVTVVDKYYLGGIWPKKLDPTALKLAADGENLIDTITFSVSMYFNTASAEFAALFGGSAARAAGFPGTLGKG